MRGVAAAPRGAHPTMEAANKNKQYSLAGIVLLTKEKPGDRSRSRDIFSISPIAHAPQLPFGYSAERPSIHSVPDDRSIARKGSMNGRKPGWVQRKKKVRGWARTLSWGKVKSVPSENYSTFASAVLSPTISAPRSR